MTLALSEADVRELLPMERAMECVEASFFAQGSGGAVNRARERIILPHVSLHYMAAALPGEGWLGMKVYTVTRAAFRFAVLLFDAESGSLLAWIQADHLGRIRTGAASGIASKHLARSGALRVGLIGTGRQARTQLEAVAKVRKLTAAKVFGRDGTRCRDFCREMGESLCLPVEPAGSAEEAARFGDIVVTATSSREPVVFGEWLRPGTHVNAIGANATNRRELDSSAVGKTSLIAVDSLEQARKESGDLIHGLAESGRGWEGVVELYSIVTGKQRGRGSEEQITLFKSHGIALWDVAVAGYVYRQAMLKGRGREVAL
jgi:alanine dehydrogenase